jgi:hypothetical protein
MDHVSHDSVERTAALILVVGGAIFTAIALRTRPVHSGSVAFHALPAGAAGRRPDAAAAAAAVRRTLVIAIAGLSAGAAVIHLAAAPSHYAEIGDLAAGFVASAAFQAIWVRWCLAGPSRRTIVVGITGNLAIVAAWTWTRTVGLPVGAFAGSPEPVGYPDSASVAFELLIVVGLVIRWLDLDLALARRSVVRAIASVAVVPVLGLVMILTSLAMVAITEGLDHGSQAGQPATEHVAAHQ